MPSLRDVAPESWRMVVHNLLQYSSSWKFQQLAAGQLLSGKPVRYRKGWWYGPSIIYKITPAGSLSSSQPGGPTCSASPLAFSLIESMGVATSSFDLDVTWGRLPLYYLNYLFCPGVYIRSVQSTTGTSMGCPAGYIWVRCKTQFDNMVADGSCCDDGSRNISDDVVSGCRTGIGRMAMAAKAMIKAVAD
jgi:hypothetical protein